MARIARRVTYILLAAVVAFTGMSMLEMPAAYAAVKTSITATARVNVKGGTVMRKKTNDRSAKVRKLKNNAKVTVLSEVYKKWRSTSKKNRWYRVKYGNKTGYIRADRLDSFNYSAVNGITTDALNYRAGAGTSMKKKGVIRKGKRVSVLLVVRSAAGLTWYKIRRGSKIYYVRSAYVRLLQTTNAKAKVAKTDTSGEFLLTDVTYPESVGHSLPFVLKGTVKSTDLKMIKAEFGIVNSSGQWVQVATKNISSKKFDIKKVDGDIIFGDISVGSYKYVGNVYTEDGKRHTVINQPFKIHKLVWPAKIASTAIKLAWPVGTAESKYKYKGGKKTPEYKEALETYYPDRSSWGAAPRAGASCDVFVGTAVRASGYDPDMPRGLGTSTIWGHWQHLAKSDKWQTVRYSYKESDLKSGDIIIYQRKNGKSEHICIYVKINGQGYLAEAAIKTYYGHLSKVTSGSKIFKKSDKKKLYVYRATH